MSRFLNVEERNEPLCYCTNDSHAIFQMMTAGEVWNPTDLFKVGIPEALKERQISKAARQATKFLEKQALTVS